jgi:hypothetical protein
MAIVNVINFVNICRYAAPAPRDASVEETSQYIKLEQPVIRLRTCNAFRHWLEKHQYDFDDVALRRRLASFIESVEDRKMQNMLAKGTSDYPCDKIVVFNHAMQLLTRQLLTISWRRKEYRLQMDCELYRRNRKF